MASVMDEPNVTVVSAEEAGHHRFLAWRMFMSRLAPTGFTVKPEYQEKWWGFRDDQSLIDSYTTHGKVKSNASNK